MTKTTSLEFLEVLEILATFSSLAHFVNKDNDVLNISGLFYSLCDSHLLCKYSEIEISITPFPN